VVAGTHPDDIDLFDFVEDDLPEARRREIEAHLETCSVCSEQVTRVEAGREALHGARLMHLPERRREGVLMNLPTQAREPERRRALTPKQLIAVLTPVLATAAVVAVLVNSAGNSGSGSAERAGGGAAASAETRATSGGSGSGSGPQAAMDRAKAALSTSGTADEVAGELRDKGFNAFVRADKVVVEGASKKAVREALADRGPGDVEVVVSGR